MLKKKLSVALVTCASLLALSTVASAESNFPNKPIRLIVPFTPGGTADIIGRVFAAQLSVELKQTVVVENKAGAGGSLGTRFVADAKPDGYTLLLASSSTHGSNPAVYNNLTYDATTDFTPITLMETIPGVLSVTSAFPANNMAELIKALKAKPDEYTYASSGAGGLGNLAMELFKSIADVEILHIPYKGAGNAFSDVISGQVSMIWEPIAAELPFIKSGQLKPIAIAAEERSDELPDVPTFKEAGIANYNALAWNGLLGPKDLPSDVLEKLHTASVNALNNAEVKLKLTQLGGEVVANTPEEFAKVIQDDVSKWKKVAKEANISLNN